MIKIVPQAAKLIFHKSVKRCKSAILIFIHTIHNHRDRLKYKKKIKNGNLLVSILLLICKFNK